MLLELKTKRVMLIILTRGLAKVKREINCLREEKQLGGRTVSPSSLKSLMIKKEMEDEKGGNESKQSS